MHQHNSEVNGVMKIQLFAACRVDLSAKLPLQYSANKALAAMQDLVLEEATDLNLQASVSASHLRDASFGACSKQPDTLIIVPQVRKQQIIDTQSVIGPSTECLWAERSLQFRLRKEGSCVIADKYCQIAECCN